LLPIPVLNTNTVINESKNIVQVLYTDVYGKTKHAKKAWDKFKEEQQQKKK